jgi:hypothetical protein
MVRRHYGVRTQRFKLIHYYNLGEWELFDMQEDPLEIHSVYDDPAYANVVANLKKELAGLREKYKVPEEDPLPDRNKRLEEWRREHGEIE